MADKTRINITGLGLPLARVSYRVDDEIDLDTNLDKVSVREVVGLAVIKLAESVGAGDDARAKIDGLRSGSAPEQAYVQMLAQLALKLNATILAPDIDIDIGEWAREGRN